MTAIAHPQPPLEEVLGYFESCSNWGRWGPDDNAGTINLITPAKRREAAAMVHSGRSVSLAYPLDTIGRPGNWSPAQHYIRTWTEGCVDFVGVSYHGYATTHIDALCHIFWEGKMWNGRSAELVTSLGAQAASVEAWSQGITTRGVLLDIPRLRGTGHVTLEEPVRGWELEAAAEAEGVELRPGDAVVVYSGRQSYYAAHGEHTPGVRPQPGLHADVIPVLHKHDAAVLVWDMMDARPTGYDLFDERGAGGPVHVFAIVYLGMPLLDNALLEPLAQACADEGRYEFLLTVNPLHVKGGTGSPVNPVAVF